MVRTTTLSLALVIALCCGAKAQTPPATLKVELQDVVSYLLDTPDLSKFGTDPSVTSLTPGISRVLLSGTLVQIGDIVSVNGRPAKGTFVEHGVSLHLSPTPAAGQAVGDTNWDSVRHQTYEIL